MKSVPRRSPPLAPSVLEFPWEHEWESCHGGVVTYYGEIVVPEQLSRQKPIIGRLVGAKGRITNKILQSSGAESLKVLGTNQYFPAEDVAGSWSGPLRFMSESRTDEERWACRSLVLELLAEVGQELGFIIPQPSSSAMPEEHCLRLPHERAYPPGSMAWRVRPFAAVRPRYFQPLPHQQQKYHPSFLPPRAASNAVVTSNPTNSAATDGAVPSVDASSSHESDVDQGAASAEKLAVVDQNVISQQGQPDSCELPGALDGNACSISSTSDHSGPAVDPEPSCSSSCFWLDAMSPVPPLAAITSGDVILSEPLEEETPSSDEDLSSKTAEDAGGVNEAPGLDNLLDSPGIRKRSSRMENVEACPSAQGNGGFETCEQPAAVLESVTTVKFPHAEGNHPVIRKSSLSPPAEDDMKSQMILERLDGLLVGMAKHWINIAELTPVMKKPEEGLLDFNDEMRAALAQEVLVANRNQLQNVQMMLESILAYSSKISSSVVAEDIEKALSTIQEKLRELNKAF